MLHSKIDMHGPLQAMLLQVPDLVTAAASRDPHLEDRVQAWMVRAEEFLKMIGKGEAAEMAGLRARLIAALAQEPPHGQRRRHHWQATTAVIEEAQAVLQRQFRPIDAAIDSAVSLIQQIIAIVNIQQLYEGLAGRTSLEEATYLWDAMSNFSVLHNGIVQLKSAFPREDILTLLAEAIEAGDLNLAIIS